MTAELLRRLEKLEDALGEIARQADSHRRSTLRVAGDNVALANVRNIALSALDQTGDFAERRGEWANWIGPDDDALSPAEGAFLDLLENDIDRNPERLLEIDPALLAEMKTLVGAVEVDLDASIEGEVDL